MKKGRLRFTLLGLLCLPIQGMADVLVKNIRPGIHVLHGQFSPGQQPDGNSIILEGDRSVAVIDSGRHSTHTEPISSYISETGKVFAGLLNTHWHLDHSGGNRFLRQRFPSLTVYGSKAIFEAKSGFLKDYHAQLSSLLLDTHDPILKNQFEQELVLLNNEKALLPTVIIAEDLRLTLAGFNTQVHVARHAVTAADLWLELPEQKLIIAGDLLTYPVPFLDTACPANWLRELKKMQESSATLIIPGHGNAIEPEALRRYHHGFDRWLQCSRTEISAASCDDKWFESSSLSMTAAEKNRATQMLHYYFDLLNQRLGETRTHEGRYCP